MMEKRWTVILLGIILVIGVFFSGCSDNSGGTAAPASTTAAPVANYTAGAIVGKTATSTTSVWLILSYDKTTDQYERALIYKNADGTWGHRADSKSDKFLRVDMEKLYPVRISHVSVSSVLVVTPTVPITVATTSSGYAPDVLNITPTSAAPSSGVSVTISGSNFASGAKAMLVQSGHPTVTCTGASVSSSSISCTFDLTGLDKGHANIRVTNPDGQYGVLENQFTVGESGPVISSMSPTAAKMNETVALIVNGQNFKSAVLVKLTKNSNELVCANPVTTGTTKITCNLVVGASPIGDWTLTVRNLDGGTVGTATRTFKINNET